ncbi:MAG TPA: proton-conducting transporter membrane subunit [Candidatus Omnitrophota bacterium]|nr:proton-conducting transporter membrane subunit [Candidatus Omnitrophota bacterium]
MHNPFFVTYFVIIPLLSAFLISIIGKYVKHRYVEMVASISCFLLLVFSLQGLNILRKASDSVLVYKLGGWALPFGICMVFDGLAGFMLFTVNLIAFLICLYSINYMEKYTDKPKFFTLFFLMLTGMNGLIITGDLFNLFVFLEVASISSYALVAFGTEAEELEASFKYAIMGSVASCFIFLGIALLYGFASTLNMADMANVLSTKPSNWLIPFVSVLFLMGFGLKAALVPFHGWLPDAHSSAPASISAMLSGVLIKTLGLYALMRIFFNVLGVSGIYLSALMFLGALSIIVALVLAVVQWDIKRLLAYSTISQIGYIVLGIGLGTPLGILGGLFHLFNHSTSKSLLFLNAGAVDYSINTRDLREMSGLKQKMPVTANTNLIGSVAISGIPPFHGFFSKLIIVLACIQRGFIGYALAAVIGSLLTLSAVMKMQRYAFLGELKEQYKNIKEVPFLMKFSMSCLAIICIVGGILLLPNLKFFLDSAVNVILEGRDYGRLVMEASIR